MPYTNPQSGYTNCVRYREETVYPSGQIIAGSVLIAVPYVIGLSLAAGNRFYSPSGYHAIPIAGPWIHLANLDYSCPDNDRTGECAASAVGDVFITMGDIISGGAQLAGAITLTIGLASGKKKLVPDFGHLNIVPLPSGGAVTYQTTF